MLGFTKNGEDYLCIDSKKGFLDIIDKKTLTFQACIKVPGNMSYFGCEVNSKWLLIGNQHFLYKFDIERILKVEFNRYDNENGYEDVI